MQKLREAAEAVGALALFGVMCLIFASVLARQVLGLIIPDAFDLSRMLLGVLIFWGIAGAVAWRSLICADFLYQALGRRGRAALNVAAALATLVVLVLIGWRLWAAVLDARHSGIRTQDIGIPLFWFYGAAALAMPVALVFVLRNAWEALTGAEPEDAA